MTTIIDQLDLLAYLKICYTLTLKETDFSTLNNAYTRKVYSFSCKIIALTHYIEKTKELFNKITIGAKEFAIYTSEKFNEMNKYLKNLFFYQNDFRR